MNGLRLRPIGLGMAAVLGAGVLYAYSVAAPDCRSDLVQDRLLEILREQLQLDSVLINQITTVSGGYLSKEQQCTAQVTQIRGNIDASAMPWRSLR
jgi:hypothetical protein